MKVKLLFGIGLGLLSCVLAHEELWGDCPKVDPMYDLDMERMAGLWYLQETFNSKETCMTWNFTDNGDFTYLIKEDKTSGALYSSGFATVSLTTGTLYPTDVSGKFKVAWPLNVGGSYDFTIYYTDYDNVAGIFACQKIFFGQRQQGIIMSRIPNPPKKYVHLTRGKLTKYGIEMYYFRRVDHSDCNYDDYEEEEDESFGPLQGRSSNTDDDGENDEKRPFYV